MCNKKKEVESLYRVWYKVDRAELNLKPKNNFVFLFF